MTKARSIESKIKTLDELQKIISRLKGDGRKIVTTNGVFDILHTGHVSYLEEAKKLGDVLAIGINTDKSVKLNKGDKRPINDENSRLRVVAALEAVDYVFLFNEKEPSDWILKLRPHFHVKAGDYKMSQIVERSAVESNNGKVILVNAKGGYSTTGIIKKILDVYGR